MSDRAAYWQRLLEEWGRSGLSQAEFCRRRGVKAVTFAWWKRRLGQTGRKGRGPGPRRTRRTGFVEVALPRVTASGAMLGGVSSASDRYELVLPGGVGLRLPAGFDPEQVARLVEALVASC